MGTAWRAWWWLPAPSTPRPSQAGLHPPGSHRAGAQHGPGETQMPLAQRTELCTSRCSCKLQKSPHLWDLGGLCPVARQQLPAAPLCQGQERGGCRGLRRAHVFPCLSRGRAAAGAERLLQGSPGPWGAVAGAAVVCAKPGAWHPASPEESLVRWRVGTPGPCSPRGKQRHTRAQLGTRLREGGAPSVPPAPHWDRSLVPREGHSDAARAGGSGTVPK